MVCSVLEPRWDSAILHLLSFSFIIAATPTFLLCDEWAIYIWSWPSLISDACWSSRANTSLSGMCIMKPFVCQWQVYMGLFWCTQSHWGQLHICSLACGGASIVSSIPLLGLGVSCYLSTFHLILTFSPSSLLLPSLSHELSMHQSEKRAAWGERKRKEVRGGYECYMLQCSNGEEWKELKSWEIVRTREMNLWTGKGKSEVARVRLWVGARVKVWGWGM